MISIWVLIWRRKGRLVRENVRCMSTKGFGLSLFSRIKKSR
jgi:hypothetical protein